MDEFNKLFKGFLNQLRLEALLRASLWGGLIGGIVGITASIIIYILGFNAVWLVVVCFLIAFIITTLGFYLFRYKPGEKDVARRVDLCGLKERLITMVESKNDFSLMARMQREDAIKHLEAAKAIKLKPRLNRRMIIAASSILVFMASATTLSGLALNGYFPSFDEIVDVENKKSFSVKYLNHDGGFIFGEAMQEVSYGANATLVVAIPNDGYMFMTWSDGITTPQRADSEIKGDIEVYAQFVEIDDFDSLTNKSDKNLPDTSIDMSEIEGGLPPHGSGASGKYEEYNQIIDGETYYRDVYQEYYEEAMKILASGGVVPDYIREFIEEYFGVIK